MRSAASVACVSLPPIGAVGSPAREWRLRARLHAHGAHVGFYREGTHSLCDPAPSGQLAPGLLELAQDTMTRLRPEVARGVEAVVVSQTVRGDQQAVHLELSRPLPRHGEVWVDRAAAGLHGRERRPRSLAAPRRAARASLAARVVAGARRARRSDDAGLMRHAAAFFQGNRALLPRLVAHVLAAVPADTPVVDLYAGVGLFGIAAAAAGAEFGDVRSRATP